MRVVLLTHGGAELVIDELSKLDDIDLVGVFIETVTSPQRTRFQKLKRSIKYDGLAATAGKFLKPSAGGTGNLDLTREAAARCGVAVTEVDDFHSDDSFRALKAANAELGVIYGTNIVKESVFSIPKRGSINLHQGLAPFYRGGPPVFWELFNGEKQIGLTAHFVAAQVDTGDIVLQRAVPLKYDPSFGLDFESFIDRYRDRLRGDSARLVADAVAAIAANDFQRVPQDTSLGKRYRLPTKKEKDELRRQLKARLSRGSK